jgi:hypothetical protein
MGKKFVVFYQWSKYQKIYSILTPLNSCSNFHFLAPMPISRMNSKCVLKFHSLACKLFLMLLTPPPPPPPPPAELENLSLQKSFVYSTSYKYPNNLYLSKIL